MPVAYLQDSALVTHLNRQPQMNRIGAIALTLALIASCSENEKTSEFTESEFIEELDDLVGGLELKDGPTRDEQVVMDVYQTIGFVENAGLPEFWILDNTDRILESFRTVDAHTVADAIESTRFAAKVEINNEGNCQFSKAQEIAIDKAEAIVFRGFQGLPTRLLEFAREKKIGG